MAEQSRRISPLDKERWLLDEATPAQRQRLEAALDPQEREQLRREHQALERALFARVPPAALRRKLEASAPKRAPAKAPGLWMAAAATLALGLALVSVRPAPSPGAPSAAPSQANGERSKGLLPDVHVYRRRGASAERIVPPATLHPHDMLQLGYVAAGRSHGVLLSIDGTGAVSLHFPEQADGDTSLAPQGEQLLSSAFELDGAPGFERFFWIVWAQPIDVAQVMQAAQGLARDAEHARRGRLALPSGLEQFSALFDKESP